jgi:hypothetical protein
LEALEKTLKAISISLGSSLGAFDGAERLIRVYHAGQGWIDFFFRNTEQRLRPNQTPQTLLRAAASA